MEEKRIDNHDRIELRSPKMRKILDEVPSKLERVGIILICIILALLIVVITKIDYPYGNGESILQHILASKLF